MAQRSSVGFDRSGIFGSGSRRPARRSLAAAKPSDLPVSIGGRPLELAAGIVRVARRGAFEAEKPPAAPARARDSLGDGGERGIARAIPSKAVIQHHHLMSD